MERGYTGVAMRTAIIFLALLTPSVVLAEDTLKLLSAESHSNTEIHLTFNHTVRVDPKKAPAAFLVANRKNEILPLTRIILENQTVTLLSVPQPPEENYVIYVNNVVYGTSPKTAFLLDPVENSLEIKTKHGEPPPLTAALLAREMRDVSVLESGQSLSPQDLAMVVFVILVGALTGWISIRAFHKEV